VQRPTRSQILVALAALLGLLGLAWWLRPAPLAVEIARVTRGPLQVTVDEEGETRVRERYTVSAPTTGWLLRVALDEGDAVEPGQVVARIEPAPLDPRSHATALARLEAAGAAHSAAQARVRSTAAALEKARRDLQRAVQLRQSGTVSQDALEEARLADTNAAQEHEAARFAADAASHEMDAARAALLAAQTPVSDARLDGRCSRADPCVEVRAPAAGEVLRVFEESERIVPAGTALLEVGDPHSLEIVVDILSSDAVAVKPGARFLIHDWGGAETLEGTVVRVEPSGFTKLSALGVEEQRVNVIASLARPEPALGDRYRVEASIVLWEGDDVLQVPSSALFRHGQDWAVFAVEGGRARRRLVEIGRQAGFDAEVLRGLEAGEIAIAHPSDRIEDGTRVEPRS
jgi:HlyD family secretion protein